MFRVLSKIRTRFYRPISDPKKYPVVINNYNRLDCLRQLIDWLEGSGYRNIYVIDNASTYAPLLDFYKTMRYPLFQLDENVGHLAMWKTHIYMWFMNDYYVYTDPDVLPVSECPSDAIVYFRSLLERYSAFQKVGFGLKLDDLPDTYVLKQQVLAWEKQYWQVEIDRELYDAKIDTTFALYRPTAQGGHHLSALRTGGKYIARHLPWYSNTEVPTPEESFYRKTSNFSSSWNNRTTLYE